jgi:hypothetical protein
MFPDDSKHDYEIKKQDLNLMMILKPDPKFDEDLKTGSKFDDDP